MTGVDPSATAIERAREAHPDMTWALPDGGRAPAVPDASFDVVTCVNVLQHVADTQMLMSEARRVLVSGGVFVAAVPHHGRLQGAFTALTSFERHFDPLEPVLRFYTARSLHTLLEAFAFEEVETVARGGAPLLRRATAGVRLDLLEGERLEQRAQRARGVEAQHGLERVEWRSKEVSAVNAPCEAPVERDRRDQQRRRRRAPAAPPTSASGCRRRAPARARR